MMNLNFFFVEQLHYVLIEKTLTGHVSNTVDSGLSDSGLSEIQVYPNKYLVPLKFPISFNGRIPVYPNSGLSELKLWSLEAKSIVFLPVYPKSYFFSSHSKFFHEIDNGNTLIHKDVRKKYVKRHDYVLWFKFWEYEHVN